MLHFWGGAHKWYKIWETFLLALGRTTQKFIKLW